MEEHNLPELSALVFLLYYEIDYFCNNFIYRKTANDVHELVLTFANLCKNEYNWKKTVVTTVLKHLFSFIWKEKICGFGFPFLEKCFLFSQSISSPISSSSLDKCK